VQPRGRKISLVDWFPGEISLITQRDKLNFHSLASARFLSFQLQQQQVSSTCNIICEDSRRGFFPLVLCRAAQIAICGAQSIFATSIIIVRLGRDLICRLLSAAIS